MCFTDTINLWCHQPPNYRLVQLPKFLPPKELQSRLVERCK